MANYLTIYKIILQIICNNCFFDYIRVTELRKIIK